MHRPHGEKQHEACLVERPQGGVPETFAPFIPPPTRMRPLPPSMTLGRTGTRNTRRFKESRMRRWDGLNEFFAYPMEARKMLYRTNAIESLNSR